MKVVQLGPYPPPHGGVQTNLVSLHKYLVEQGIGCSIINLTRFRGEPRDGIYFPKTSWEVLRLLRRLDYDLVHLHVGGNLSLRHAGLLLFSSFIPQKKTVFTFHSGGYPSSAAGRRASRWSLRGFVLRRLDGIIAVNAELVKLFETFGVPARRIRAISPYTAETGASAGALPEPLASFYCAHDPVLVTVSGLEPEYDLPLQIEALGKLRLQFPRMGLAILGGGSLEDKFRGLIAGQPYREHLLLCGDAPHETTLEAVRAAALFLRTTWYDGDSISVREALHLGTPVIASDNGMRPAGVHLVPKSNLEALCQAVADDLKAPRTRQLNDSTGKENLAAVLDFYADLTGEKRAVGRP